MTAGDICLSICYNEWVRLIEEKQKSRRMFWMFLNYVVIY